MTTQLTSIHIYPIKSTAPIDLSVARVRHDGLAFDRRFVLSDAKGRMITARLAPKLVLVQTALIVDGLVLSAPDMPELVLRYADFEPGRQHVTIWRDDVEARRCHAQADAWFSRYLGLPLQLLFQDDTTHRRRSLGERDGEVSFADGYPLLLTTRPSVAEVSRRAQEPIVMRRFRPNLVIDGDLAPFAEDSWRRIRLGEVEFDLAKPCSRCVFTTIDPYTAQKSEHNEPLATLQKFRSDGQAVYFGWNLVPRNEGTLRVSDKLEVLASGEAPRFGAQAM